LKKNPSQKRVSEVAQGIGSEVKTKQKKPEAQKSTLTHPYLHNNKVDNIFSLVPGK
jgi:hypothetical protein